MELNDQVLDLSTDLPVIIEMTDSEAKIHNFIPVLNQLFEQADCGGLVTMEKVDIIRYTHGS